MICFSSQQIKMATKKIWGENTEIFRNESVSVNILEIKKGYQCSYHHHRFKRNNFYVIEGELKIRHEQGETILNKGKSFEVLPPNKHQFVAMTDVLCIETVYVKLEDADIIRSDSGGRY